MERLAVSGFVLAGGLSSRMGTDKALLEFCGRPMVEIAVATLREFCTDVAIAGNRNDLGRFAPVVHEGRVEAGPAAGVEAGLRAAGENWAVFVPVDVPLVRAALLRRWVRAVLGRECAASYLMVNGSKQPTFCAVRRECAGTFSAALDAGERRLAEILRRVPGGCWCCDAAEFVEGGSVPAEQMELLFSNVNTPKDLAAAELYARRLRHTGAGESL
jgi:molybdopterin-guanine dinucleotide biosynthesis protein A